MSFEVQFFTFAKEVNSSELPNRTGTSIPCVVNDGVDIINPVISLQRGNGGVNSPTAWNYCRIPDFNRYYFIEDWEWSGGLWKAHCSIDVLATYRTQIYNMSAYVLRSAHSFDGAVSDGMYPAKQSYSFDTITADNPWANIISAGTVVLGIAGTGTTNYYKFSYTNFIHFLSNLLSDDYVSDVIGVWGFQVYSEAKAIVDPLQYITSVKYIPFAFNETNDTSELQVGFGTVRQYIHNKSWECKAVPLGNSIVTTHTVRINSIPIHPWSTDRGEYLNHAPWSEYTIDVVPFGIVQLDPSRFRGAIELDYHVDWATGDVIIRIWGMHNVNGTLTRQSEMNVLKGKLGVDIEIGQVIARGMGQLSMVNHGANLVAQVMGGITGGAGTGGIVNNTRGFTSNFARRSNMGIGGVVGGTSAAVSGITSWIRDAIESKIPSLNSTGTLGSFVELSSTTRVNTKFIYPVFENREQRGRPLCKTMRLGDLSAEVPDADDNTIFHSGYLMIADPDIKTIAATAAEREAIRGFLEGGFYLA